MTALLFKTKGILANETNCSIMYDNDNSSGIDWL